MKYKKSAAAHQEKYCQDMFNDKFDFANHALLFSGSKLVLSMESKSKSRNWYRFFVLFKYWRQKNILIKLKPPIFSNENIAQTPYIIKSMVNFGTSGGREDT
jgi:hypothetical protein